MRGVDKDDSSALARRVRRLGGGTATTTTSLAWRARHQAGVLVAGRPTAISVFFARKATDVDVLRSLMAAVLRADEHGCLRSYTSTRSQAVATMLQLVAANVVGSASSPAAKKERQIQECALDASAACEARLRRAAGSAFTRRGRVQPRVCHLLLGNPP